MRIYMFKSESKPELRAFAEDSVGSKLPQKFAPWHVTGVITPEKKPPFNLPRASIEQAVSEHGFQLWRMKAAAGA